ncbi:MAG: hypothetical protein U0237_00140 [Thermoleophilia bacterium]
MIAELAADTARRAALGAAAAARAAERVSWVVCGDRYLALLAAARERAGRPPV